MVAYFLLFIMFLILALLVYSENRTTKPHLKKEVPKPKIKKKTEKPVTPEETEAQAKEAKEELKEATELQKEKARQRAQREIRKKAKEKAAREASEAKEEAEKAAEKEAQRKALEETEAKRKAQKEKAARETAQAEAKKQAKEEAATTAKEAKALPAYPDFDHSRLVEMGLSDEEAKDFVKELISQIEEQLPLIEKALQEGDFHQMEQLTHSIKGSSTNIGTGGVADLLIDYNTYLKTGNDPILSKSYYEELKIQLERLKVQYL
ncbi:Hpt domain-containing protein [Sulfurovum sp. NBC37-1]|uniref:Hpt domain-containing protein n=1 Tax=Sulfurovum sp. (strain NBC37-1) TaxID=387093 RepID=UPI0001587644|nr:Hpt domain-containing protein [Sulfurovum sp. NBC37-1]BAF72185.1 hypothetical protein SUN_1231 [Sulfurovum sp. NBC37-1]